MQAVLINGSIYCIYGYLIYCFLHDITPFSFVIMFYVVPIVINTIFSVIYINKRKKVSSKIVSPTFSTINYILLGFILQTNGLWKIFVEKYSVATKEVSISIASRMITLSQIVFVILLYFGINYLVTIILIKFNKKE